MDTRPDPGPDQGPWRERVEAVFAAHGALALIGATLILVEPGAVDIALPFRPELGQHLGFYHGGIIATVLDSACGMAALTRMTPEQEVVTAEFKLNFLAPAQGARLVARGRVVKAGRLLSVCTGNAYIQTETGERHVALMQATMAAIAGRA